MSGDVSCCRRPQCTQRLPRQGFAALAMTGGLVDQSVVWQRNSLPWHCRMRHLCCPWTGEYRLLLSPYRRPGMYITIHGLSGGLRYRAVGSTQPFSWRQLPALPPMAHPTTLREKASVTTARYSQPSPVRCWVTSATRFRRETASVQVR
jgi:hypothetical protein